jgi:hypothetical protein
MKNNLIFLALAVILVFLFSACTQQPRACTMEARLCPDGTSVGRTGPNCEFASCPGASSQSPEALPENSVPGSEPAN